MAKDPRRKRYTDEEQAEFCELAQVIGVGRAVRELGYPSFPMAYQWLDKRGIEPQHSDIMANARKYQRAYETEDLIKTVDDAVAVTEELYATASTADEVKKLSEAIQKLVNTRLLLEGKANSINESRQTTQQDLAIAEMLRAERVKQETAQTVEEVQALQHKE